MLKIASPHHREGSALPSTIVRPKCYHDAVEIPFSKSLRFLGPKSILVMTPLLLLGCQVPHFSSKHSASMYPELGIPQQPIADLESAFHGMSAPSFAYPWHGLEDSLGKFPNGELPLIGYGSLLNPKSAARTIADTPSQGHPAVLAMGARRIFNYKMPEKALARYPDRSDPLATAALNLEYSRSSHDFFNGRLVAVAPGDIKGLRERERGYDLEPVVYVPWNRWDAHPQVAYVLVARNRPGQRVVDASQRPHPEYAELCLAGARLESPAFATFYLKTTFLADGRTSLWKVSQIQETHVPVSP
jgi:hypothetical protein